MEFDVISYAIGKNSAGSGGDVTVESITFTQNGNYDAPSGKTYSPVYVRVPETEQATPVLTVNGATVTATATQEAGVVEAGVKTASTTVETARQATPTISVNTETGVITASATQSAGYVVAGTKSATEQLSTQAAVTITPTTSDQTAVAANKYTVGAVTVAGDADLVAGNIKSGVSVFGVTGTYTDDADAAAANILAGKTAYVAGAKVTGTAQASWDGNTLVIPEGLVTINA